MTHHLQDCLPCAPVTGIKNADIPHCPPPFTCLPAYQPTGRSLFHGHAAVLATEAWLLWDHVSGTVYLPFCDSSHLSRSLEITRFYDFVRLLTYSLTYLRQCETGHTTKMKMGKLTDFFLKSPLPLSPIPIPHILHFSGLRGLGVSYTSLAKPELHKILHLFSLVFFTL